MHDRRLARSRGRSRAVDDRTGHPDSDRTRVRARAARKKVEPPALLSAPSCSLYHYHRSQVCEPHLPELHPREFRLRAFDTPASIPRGARKQKKCLERPGSHSLAGPSLLRSVAHLNSSPQ
jgi:hypothetical protein